MKKKYIIIAMFFIILALIVFLIAERKQDDVKVNKDIEYSKNIEPISREIALKILKSQYGDSISNTEEDIKQVGDEYIIDVHVKLDEHEAEGEHEHIDSKDASHEQSIGTYKINIYTGELTKSEK
ncbi:MAG: hypothetical protein RSC84_02890 [Peptostreptococcaceae bacterium]